jgi:hypothetical protein
MKRHAFDAVSFAFGLLFLIAGIMLLGGTPNVDALQWLGPVAFIGLGALILIATVPRRGADAVDGTPGDEPMGDGGGEA